MTSEKLERKCGVRALAALMFAVGLFFCAGKASAIENELCLGCHSAAEPKVDEKTFGESIHGVLECTNCHMDISEIPHSTPVEKVSCAMCHSEEDEEYKISVHGVGLAKKEEDVPDCKDCHGKHDIFPATDSRSKVYPLTLVETCGKCHSDEKLAIKHSIPIPDPYHKYLKSSHGQGLLKSGLLVSAVCNDCHGSHKILPHTDPNSSINRKNIPATCGACHAGIKTTFDSSIHGQILAGGSDSGPTCTTCHQSHNISRVSKKTWKLHIVKDCGNCHAELMESYQETYHGKVVSLGFAKVARCSDCHGSHNIFPPSDPRSPLSEKNIVETCSKCHPNANENFTQYLTHANHKDKENYPVLFYTFWFMTLLLIGTFSFFGIHTLLWLLRTSKDPKPAHHPHVDPQHKDKMYVRFGLYERFIHFLIIISFLTLALTGIPLKFSYAPWAASMAKMLGGFEVAGNLHRTAAVISFLYAFLYLSKVVRRALNGEQGIFWGPGSMVPQPKDLQDIVGHMRWFLGQGERPKFDRWTYWEKFDFWAVFWGIAVIGTSGLFLWFPTVFSKLLPGWVFNVAIIIHSDEALLAAGFIFSIHFFNSHLRPEKFPMDFVIFTGKVSVEELALEKPLEYERVKATGELEKRLGSPVEDWQFTAARIFGFSAVAIGLVLLSLIISALFFF